MKKNRIFALALAAVLGLCTLTACNDIEVPDNTVLPENGAESSDTTNTPDASSGENEENTTEEKKGLDAYNWKYSDDEVLFTVGGEPVTFEMYRYYAMNSKAYYDQGDAAYWNDETNAQYKNDIINEFKSLTATKLICNNDLGLKIEDTDIKNMESSLDQLKTYLGEDALNSQLNTLYLNKDLYIKMSEYDYLREKLYRHFVTNDEIKAYANENYVHVQHILVSTQDAEGNDLTGDAFDEKTAFAYDIYKRAVSGEDFYSLVEQYGEDPGMEGNPDGYTFTYNMMVKEFEEASFELEVGAISEPVKTPYGYHIIKKLPLDEEYFLDENSEDFWNILYTLGDTEVNSAVEEYKKNLEVVPTEKFNELNMGNIGEIK